MSDTAVGDELRSAYLTPEWPLIKDREFGRRAVALQQDLEMLWPEIHGTIPVDTLLASSNGRIPASELSAIPGGHLRHDAARAWIDMRDFIGRKHGVWIQPTGPNSSYRTYAAQEYFWSLYVSGRGNLAAHPGTSNHGWGVAVDVATPQMVFYIRMYGARFGWRKTEAFSEWWHYNYVGGYKPVPRAKPLPKALNRRDRNFSKKLIYHRHRRSVEAPSGHGARWHEHNKWAKYWDRRLRKRQNRAHGTRARALRAVIEGDYNY